VVLACGTYFTPIVLLKNGLANGSGQVGRNLSVHPSACVGALFDERIDAWDAIPQGYGIDHYRSSGLHFENSFLPLDLFTVTFDLAGPDLTELMESYRHVALSGFIVSETSRGRVLPMGGNFPLITYSLNEPDWRRVRRGFEKLSEIFFAAGARRVYLPVAGHVIVNDANDLERFRAAPIKSQAASTFGFHPLGTCRMGASPMTSVVDSSLETWDVPGLHVMDGSVVPTPLMANPQLTIMALATHGATKLAEDLG